LATARAHERKGRPLSGILDPGSDSASFTGSTITSLKP
jgi:hypothetical protein